MFLHKKYFFKSGIFMSLMAVSLLMTGCFGSDSNTEVADTAEMSQKIVTSLENLSKRTENTVKANITALVPSEKLSFKGSVTSMSKRDAAEDITQNAVLDLDIDITSDEVGSAEVSGEIRVLNNAIFANISKLASEEVSAMLPGNMVEQITGKWLKFDFADLDIDEESLQESLELSKQIQEIFKQHDFVESFESIKSKSFGGVKADGYRVVLNTEATLKIAEELAVLTGDSFEVTEEDVAMLEAMNREVEFYISKDDVLVAFNFGGEFDVDDQVIELDVIFEFAEGIDEGRFVEPAEALSFEELMASAMQEMFGGMGIDPSMFELE